MWIMRCFCGLLGSMRAAWRRDITRVVAVEFVVGKGEVREGVMGVLGVMLLLVG